MTPGPVGVPPTQQQKKGMSGCVIALLVLGGVLVVMCLIGGVAMWRVSQSEDGKKVFSALGKGVQMAQKGLTAPGTEELRRAGCSQAMVLETDDIMGVVDIFVDAGERQAARQELPEVMVMCQGRVFDDLPDCATVAKTYVEAVHPAAPFNVTVQKQGNNKPICQQRYASDGTPQGR